MSYLLLLIPFLLSLADEPKADKGDLEQIVGTWVAVSVNYQGENYDPGEEGRVIISRDLIKYQPEGPGKNYGYSLDPSTNPKGLTLQPLMRAGEMDPPGQRQPEGADLDGTRVAYDNPIHGIYTLEGDRLTLCVMILDNGETPTKFSAEKGEGTALEVCRRVEKGSSR